MARLLRGAPVAEAISARVRAEAEALKAAGTVPTLAILRVGERPDDLSYERGAMKRCESVDVAVKSVVLPENTEQSALMRELDALNSDSGVHGVLVFRPLPEKLDGEAVRRALAPEKDVDGITDGSLAGVFTGSGSGFAPCTARAVTELLDYYGIDCDGKRAVVIGRSLVVGRPAAMLLMQRGATVTICHTHTKNLAAVTREADIVVAAAGRAEAIGESCLSPGQTAIDVGMSWSEEKQKLCGDFSFDEASAVVGAITPVPGGVGAVTTSVLALHTVQAARRSAKAVTTGKNH